MKITRINLMLLVVLLLGLLLRVYHLGGKSIWLDEAYSISLAHLSLEEMLRVISSEINQPAYFSILHFWVGLFGDGEFSVRFLSVIFGFFAIFMMYKVGRLLFDKKTGLLSALFLGIAEFQIHYSQEAKMYSLIVLLALLSMYFFLRFLKEQRLIPAVSYIVFTTVFIYTHASGFLIVVAQNSYLLFLYFFSSRDQNLSFRKWFILQITVLTLFLPWAKIFMQQVLLIVGV